MKSKYILTMDQGTTSSRAILFNHDGHIVESAQKEFTQIYPKPSWVEHNPNEIWSSQAGVAAEVISKLGINGLDIAAIGITNQRETVIVWDKDTGKPIYNAIVWQDRRTSNFCNELKNKGYDKLIQDKTGLIIDAYFSASKIKWILDNVEGAREKAEKGKLYFGTVDTWLIYKFTNKKHHLTDVSNASRTMLFNINTLKWDDELLDLFNIPKSMLPKVKQSSEVFCKTATTLFAHKIPISGVAGDQHAALFGQMCLEEGMLKTTYGTGCFLMTNVGSTPKKSNHKLLSTIAWQINGKVTYALEGSVFIGGAVIQWLRDELEFIKKSSESEYLALTVKDTNGVYVVPALAGLGAPHWDQSARGIICGLTRGSNKAHITRAALESIAYQVNDLLKAKEADTGIKIKEMRVDGGAVANNFLMQFQADLIQGDIIRPTILETTALGATYFAGLAVGYWKSTDELKEKWKCEKVFKAEKPQNEVNELVKGWDKAISRSKNWE